MERPECAEEGEGVMTPVLANPVEMIERGAPHVIHSEAELVEYTRALEELTSVDRPTLAQIEAIELLTLLVASCEGSTIRFPRRPPSKWFVSCSISMG
jgi:HTH-type transcriptional regulator / antitoxin HigA